MPVVSNEAFQLDASQSVNILIDALRCLTRPDDNVSLASLTMAYRTKIKGFAGTPDELLTRKPEDNLPPSFVQRREELKLMPLYELLEELVELFNVTALTLRAAIRAVYKSGVLNPCEVERRTKMPNGHYLETYSLPMVVALAFRINTSNAVMVRKALLERLCLRKERQVLLVSMGSKPSCRC